MTVARKTTVDCTDASEGGGAPLAAASRRLRRPAGRQRRVLRGLNPGTEVKGATSEPAKTAAKISDFATTLPPRGLPLPAAAAYSGLPVRALWRLIAAGKLAPVRVPGTRRVLVLRDHLDSLLEASVQAPEPAPEAG